MTGQQPMTAPTRDPFLLLADQLRGAQACRLTLAAAVSATATHVTVDMLGSRVTVPRLAGPTPTAGALILVLRQGSLTIAAGALAAAVTAEEG